MKTGLTILTVSVVVCLVLIMGGGFHLSDEAPASNEPLLSYTTKVVEAEPGTHGSVWKFQDGNRTCYFNARGGIWCTN